MTRRRIVALLFATAFVLSAATACSRGGADSNKPASQDNSKQGSSQGQGSGAAKGQSGNSNEGEGAGKAGGSSNASVIKLTPDQLRNAGIRVTRLAPVQVPRTITAPAQVALDEQRTAHVSPVVDGRVTAIYAKPGDHVTRGAVLAHLHSHAIHDTIGAIEQDMADVARRQAAVAFQQQRADRYTHLYSIQAASLEESQRAQQDLLQSKNELAFSEVALHTEREHLADVLQVPPSTLTPDSLGHLEDAPIRAAIAGTVVARFVTPGMVLAPGTEVFTISDLRSVWVIAAINEADLASVRQGDPVTVRSAAWPGESFSGRVTLIGSTLDPTTRTVQVRATVPNPQGKLKPSMFATADIGERATRPALFVPEDAVQDVNGVPTVFITADGASFTAQAVKTAKPVHGQLEVLQGLKPGDNVAVAGTFTLKSELLKSSIGQD